MLVLNSIIEWAQNDLYRWQSDAVRRLLTQDKLTEQDEKEILGLLKVKYGLLDQKKLGIVTKPVKKGDISGAPKVTAKITLKAMTSLLNVNKLPDGSELPFGHEGLTIIYGENASGKSGYARVLKRACSARDTKERILPNVFADKPSSPAKASFKISINGGSDEPVGWEDGVDSPDILANISVFDAKCARVIVNENNEATYLPYGTHVFEDLVSLIKRIRNQLQQETPEPKKLEYPDISLGTKSSQFLMELTDKVSNEEIEKATLWNGNDEKRLLELQKRIAKAQANDLQKQVTRLRNLRDRTIQLANILTTIEDTLSIEKTEIVKGLIKELNVAEKALAIISIESLTSEPLAGVGNSVWRSLYEAAKRYSIEVAYVGKDFPELEEGSRCVFCMQPLSEEARKRLLRFKAFMEEASKKKAEEATGKIEYILKNIREINETLLESYKDVLDEINTRNDRVAEKLKEFYFTVLKRAKCIVQAVRTKNEEFSLPVVTSSPIKYIRVIADELENDAKKIKEITDLKKIDELNGEKEELQARKHLLSKKKQVFEYVESLKIVYKYNRCIEETEFTAITRKGKEIISRALTPELTKTLQQELKELGVSHLPLNLKPYGIEGETSHKMELKGIQFSQGVNLTDILSEGEQCVIAIAGFLAELNTGKHECPIVLDDPVCSLDHIYREKIAERLVKEAVCRQVIIFTHDIAFLLELEQKAVEKKGIPIFSQAVSKDIDKLGKPEGGLPWHAMSVNKRISYLESRLANFQKFYRSNTKMYNEKAGSLYSMLRETWEAAIEEILFNKTISRHRNEVKTLSLSGVEVTDEDFRKIQFGMTQCSTWMLGHDKAKSVDENRPSPEEIRKDIDKLKSFIRRVKQRKTKKEIQRKALLKPRKPEVG